jgi:hypothetical protein
MDWPLALVVGRLATSTASVIPLGAVQVREEAKVCEVTTMVPGIERLMLGVACVLALAVVCPSSASTGPLVSTPEKLWIPPTAWLNAESVHVYEVGSLPPSVLR